jgi:hypothetical protein
MIRPSKLVLGRRVAAKLVSAFAIAVALGVTVTARQAPAPAAAAPVPSRPNPAMNGVWDYNDALSVDAATGRPEQAPLSATQRPRRGTAATTGNATTGTTSGPAANPRAGSVDDFERNAMLAFISERRALFRDLLEVPELLRIRVTSDSVVFTDDLLRERTYPVNGKMQKYQIGAARFEARAYWDGAQLRKDIEAPNDFKMTELYLLSEDGKRLHVVIRIGDPKRPETIIGVNRIYDKVAR